MSKLRNLLVFIMRKGNVFPVTNTRKTDFLSFQGSYKKLCCQDNFFSATNTRKNKHTPIFMQEIKIACNLFEEYDIRK